MRNTRATTQKHRVSLGTDLEGTPPRPFPRTPAPKLEKTPRLLEFALCILFALSFTGSKASEELTFSHVGLARTYRLHLPPGSTSDSPLPLIVALHGATMNGKQMEGLTKLTRLSNQTREFAVAYPSADPKGNAGIWDFLSPRIPTAQPSDSRITSGRDDLGFLSALMESLVAEGVANPKRIYLTGMSNGAFLANRFVLEEPGRIAAMGLVAGTFPRILEGTEDTGHILPIAYFHGTGDEIVKIDGSSFLTKQKLSLSAREYTEWWVKRNAIAARQPETMVLPNRDPEDACRVERLRWDSEAAPVVFYRIRGGGHTWTGGPDTQPTQLLGPIAKDIDASTLLWNFFRNFQLE
ncbi:MAG: PHB depolymerase family esterase [Verrucomicrobiales bacterium]|nr:PHB depolymerase family esterase [Verrucomicrobiales bacterium]